MTPGKGLRQTPRKATPEVPASGPRVPGAAPDIQPEVACRDVQASPSGSAYRRQLSRLGRQRPGLGATGAGTHQARWALLSRSLPRSPSSGPQHARPLCGPKADFPNDADRPQREAAATSTWPEPGLPGWGCERGLLGLGEAQG